MTNLRRLVIALMLPVMLLTGVFYWDVPKVDAAGVACSGPVVMFGRQRWCGYFKNIGYDSGQDVRIGGIPASMDTVNEFINLVEGDLNSGNAHRITSAQFIILTMLGRGPGNPKSVSPAQLVDWRERVKSYGDASENGTTSWGENGRIDWKTWQRLPCGTTNTYYQVGQNDVAPFFDSPSNSDCETSIQDQFVLFRDRAGNIDYRIRRLCMNPMGALQTLEKPTPDQYNLEPSIGTTVNGNLINGGVEVGQTIRFAYAVRNNGDDPSPSANCVIYTNVHSGFFDEPPAPTGSGGAGPPTGCPKVFGAHSNTQLMTEDVPVNTDNQTICRSLFVSPATATVASRGFEVCVPVVSKPYFKVTGGDVSVGGGLETAPSTCTLNDRAAIIGWNKGPAGYGGAGVQFAAMALSQIFETSTSFGNGAGSAPKPNGLAFANTSPITSVYGGSFGSVPCVTDYFAAKPASAQPFTTLAAADTSGVYEWNGPGTLNLSGSIGDGDRITLYVDGDVAITGNIRYPANWSSARSPLLQLIVKGNIFIGRTVNTIDGVYIAQKSGASGGSIYTCANGSAAVSTGSGNYYSRCSQKLTINGALVANQVWFLRTHGTLEQATANEAKGSGNIAEEINFSPVLWMAQPAIEASGAFEYDSISSLPPVL